MTEREIDDMLRHVRIDGQCGKPRRGRRTCGQCKKKLVRRTGRGTARSYCSPACRQRAYRARSALRPANPIRLMRQDLRQILETDRLKRVAIEVFKEMGVFDFLETIGWKSPEPQPPQLKLVKSPPNDSSEEQPL